MSAVQTKKKVYVDCPQCGRSNQVRGARGLCTRCYQRVQAAQLRANRVAEKDDAHASEAAALATLEALADEYRAKVDRLKDELMATHASVGALKLSLQTYRRLKGKA